MEANQVLGKNIEYPKQYCPEILVAVPRRENREKYGINHPDSLFCGFDTWHAYEASFLLDNGLPLTGILKIVYPATSPSIVESKSLKLYLASYNMEKMGKTPDEAIRKYTRQITHDLAALLQTDIECHFHTPSGLTATLPSGFDFEGYRILEQDLSGLTAITAYEEKPSLLEENALGIPGELKAGSHLLRSNCKITRQPDWGSIYIYLRGDCLPAEASLLKYIVSLRNENHFHEEICEMVYKRLADTFHPEALAVTCLYTRRGGIDICPARASEPSLLPSFLQRPALLSIPAFRQ